MLFFYISSLFNFLLFFKVCGISLLKQCTNLYSYPVLTILLFFLSVLFLLLLLLVSKLLNKILICVTETVHHAYSVPTSRNNTNGSFSPGHLEGILV